MTQSPSDEDANVAKVLRAVAGTPDGVYSPSDDTFLMLDVLAGFRLEGREVLDVGTGSGALGLYCAMRGAQVTATDIDQKALGHALKAAQDLRVNLRIIHSDLFSNVTGRFDLVVFNPPYLRSIGTEDPAVDGGESGQAVAERLLNSLASHLKEGGQSLIILSSASDTEFLATRYPDFEFSIVASKRLFFEELRVLQLRLRRGTSR